MMGFPMARRLLNVGHDVVVWNRSAGKAALLVEAGAKLKAYPRDVASSASIVFMCVTDATAVESVVFGRDGLAAAPGAGKLVVDFSLIHPDAARDIAARLKAANGMAWVYAAVSVGTKGAEEGTLAVMGGGEAADIERVRPYVLAMLQIGEMAGGADRKRFPRCRTTRALITTRRAGERSDRASAAERPLPKREPLPPFFPTKTLTRVTGLSLRRV
jgi:3-hydroxyisobutyrate dehydrogenase-like beta-hydroxyacid dehydrogenase